MPFRSRASRRTCRAWPIALVLLAAGCTTYDGPQRYAEIRRDTQLKASNFKIVHSHVQGQASCLHLAWFQMPVDLGSVLGLNSPLQSVGILAFQSPDLRERAMEDLHESVDLTGKPQILDGLIEEWTVSSYLGLFATVTVTVSADVIEFNDTSDDGDGDGSADRGSTS